MSVDPEPFIHFINSVNPSITPNAQSLSASTSVSEDSVNSTISCVVTHQLPSPTPTLTPEPPGARTLPVLPTFIPPPPQLEFAVHANPNVEKRILAYIYVSQPREAIRTGQRKTRLVKQDPLAYGPTPIPYNVTFDRLLEIVSDTIQTRAQDIDSNSIQWKPRTPANAKLQPLRDVAGVNGMLSQVLAKAKPLIDYIIEIKLDPPRKTRPVYPWNEDGDNDQTSLGSMTIPGSSSSKTVDDILGFSEGAVDGSGVGPTVAKGKFDSVLLEIQAQIFDKYPVGNCREHSKVRCFVHAPTGHHFDLNNARSLTWAQKIKAGGTGPGTDLVNAPFGQHLWKPHHAMKTATQTSSPSTLPVTPVTATHAVPTSTAASPTGGVQPAIHTPSTTQAFLPQFIPMMAPFFNPFAMASPMQPTNPDSEEP